jgi:hypothetical protein
LITPNPPSTKRRTRRSVHLLGVLHGELLGRSAARVALSSLLAALIVLALSAGTRASAFHPSSWRGSCGIERWDVKTLSDPAAHQVNFQPVDRRVAVLRRLDGPVVHEDSPRFGGVERQTIRVRAQVLEAKVEDDSDIHLVIAPRSHRGKTMIVEFPAPHCVASPFKRPEIRAARRSLLSRCPAIGSSDFTLLHGNVVITGVGFWDILHGQTGVAPNGIELHPVLSFTGTCA